MADRSGIRYSRVSAADADPDASDPDPDNEISNAEYAARRHGGGEAHVELRPLALARAAAESVTPSRVIHVKPASAASAAASAADEPDLDADDGLHDSDPEADGDDDGVGISAAPRSGAVTRAAPALDEHVGWTALRWLRRSCCGCCVCCCGCACGCRTASPATNAAAGDDTICAAVCWDDGTGLRSASAQARAQRVSRVRRSVCFAFAVVCVLGALSVAKTLYDDPKTLALVQKPCLTDPAVLQSVRDEVGALCRTFEAHNVTYWLDYGTALGAWRRHDILPWDHDADVSVLARAGRPDWDDWHAWLYALRRSVIDAHNGFDGVDLFLWFNGTSAYADAAGDGLMHRVDEIDTPRWWNDRYDVFDPQLMQPLVRCDFGGAQCMCWPDFKAQAKRRYTETWFISIPYRLRCLLEPTVIWHVITTINFAHIWEGIFQS